MAHVLARAESSLSRDRIKAFYPDTGPLRRELYPKHQAFLAAGAKQRIRAFIAANRVGKTESVGAYELVLHMTGDYPPWWAGRRFNRPIKAWACGENSKTLREILQDKILGKWNQFGTGLVPADRLVDWTNRQGVAESIDTFMVRHKSGGISHGLFKSYDQTRKAFEGTEIDVILLDEEPPLDIYSECVIRTMTNHGIVLLTFTPLAGTTALIVHLREAGVWEISATWDDVPHLSEEVKDELWTNTPAYMREARSKGIPSRGSGVVFPVAEEMIKVAAFKPPREWAWIAGLDFGWDHPTAAAKCGHDRDNDVFYVVGEYREREVGPVQVAAGVRPWGKWLPYAWPHDGLRHDKGTGKDSGKQWSKLYEQEGLYMLPEPASFSDDVLDIGVEAGVGGMLAYMQAGRFKIMDTCERTLQEFRDYYRKEGIIVKERDDLMSAVRVAFMMRRHARVKPYVMGSPGGSTPKPPNWRTA